MTLRMSVQSCDGRLQTASAAVLTMVEPAALVLVLAPAAAEHLNEVAAECPMCDVSLPRLPVDTNIYIHAIRNSYVIV